MHIHSLQGLTVTKSFNTRTVANAATAFAFALALTACNKSPEAPEGAEDQAAPAAAETPATAAQTAQEPGMDVPLTQEQAGAKYSIKSEPVIAGNQDILRMIITVENTGSTAILSKGKMPVNLAISLVDDAGNYTARDFIRASLPAEGISAGSSAEVVTEVPLKDVIGKTLRFGLVQEGVAWYSDFNVTPIDYGPFTTCSEQGKSTVCGKDGKPLQKAGTN